MIESFNIFIISGLILLFISVLIHELGHWIALSQFGIKPKLNIKKGNICMGADKDYKKLNSRQQIFVYAFGIVCGIFIFLPAVISNGWYFIFLILNLAGCKKDFMLIWKNLQRKKN